MLLVLALAAVVWGVGRMLDVPARSRWVMIAALYVAVLLEQMVLPDGHPLREATGQSPALWLLLGGFVALALIYARGVRWLKERAHPIPEPVQETRPGTFAEGELERYARHIVLRELGGPGQKRLKQAIRPTLRTHPRSTKMARPRSAAVVVAVVVGVAEEMPNSRHKLQRMQMGRPPRRIRPRLSR